MEQLKSRLQRQGMIKGVCRYRYYDEIGTLWSRAEGWRVIQWPVS